MEKTRRQIAREKAIIGVYQNILVNSSFDEILLFLNEDKTLSCLLYTSMVHINQLVKQELLKELIMQQIKIILTICLLVMHHMICLLYTSRCV